VNSSQKTKKLGRNGNVVIPISFRRRLGLRDGEYIILEDRGIGILIRPARIVPRLTPGDLTERPPDDNSRRSHRAAVPHRRARAR